MIIVDHRRITYVINYIYEYVSITDIHRVRIISESARKYKVISAQRYGLF